MADESRMALAELLRKAEAEPGLDLLREGVRVLAEALMDAGGRAAPGRRAARADAGADRAAQRLPGAGLGHAGGHRSTLRVPRVRDGELLPEPAGAAHAGGAGAGGGGAGSLRRRASRRGGWMPWSRRWGWRASARARSAGCARSWTRRSSASARGRWRRPIRTSGWMRPSSRCARRAGWSRRRWSSPSG